MDYSSYLFILCCIVFPAALVFLAVNARGFFREEKPPAARVWIILAAIAAFGGWMRFSQAPQRFKVFYDEYENYNSSRMILRDRDFSFCEFGTVARCEKRSVPIHPVGFPFLGAAAMGITGQTTPETLFGLNALLGTLCIPAIFLMGLAAGAGAATALFMALLAAMLPLHVIVSTSAGPETASFLMLCMFLFFLIVYLRKGAVVAIPGLIFSMAAAILARPENVLVLGVAAVAATARRPFKPKELGLMGLAILAAAALLAPLHSVYGNIFAMNRQYIASSQPPGAFGALSENLSFFFHSPVLPWFFAALALGGIVVQLKERVCGIWPAAFFIMYAGVLGILNIRLQEGDFSRHALSISICLVFWGGLFLGRIYEAKKLPGGKATLIAALIMMLFVCYNRSFMPFTDYLEAQDDFLAKTLPSLPKECSIFTPGTSAGMAYTSNRTYDVGQLLDAGFVKNHAECKIIVQDVFCATSFYDKCRAVADRYDVRQLKSGDMLGYFNASVGIAVEKPGKNR